MDVLRRSVRRTDLSHAITVLYLETGDNSSVDAIARKMGATNKAVQAKLRDLEALPSGVEVDMGTSGARPTYGPTRAQLRGWILVSEEQKRQLRATLTQQNI